ncbi:MAG: glycosyltransferase [Chitinophagales bacterium]|nr:glycosyltransferase [Chitinophagaceae bacterium]MCB9066053.1 glycosyltransferase [Chitinophagales bacterium]
MFAQVVFFILLISLVVQTGYVLYFFGHVFSLPLRAVKYTPEKPVSIIVCAHNEADNLRDNLPLILAQRYINDTGNAIFEVIVVNDASDDDTAAVLASLQQEYDILKVVNISADEERTYPGKKFALSKGVEAAANNVLLMTDADCTPASKHWLKNMAHPFHEGKELVVGYGKYRSERKLLNAFTRWETVHTFLQYTSYALAGNPYMGVGRNIACTRDAFLRAQQTPSWSLLPSGDDDLLVSATANKTNIGVVATSASFTLTDARDDMDKWVAQKRRHLSTGKYYKSATKLLLGTYGTAHMVIWVSFIISLFTRYWDIALVAMSFRCLIYWLIWWYSACILNEKKLIRFFPLFDFGWMIYNFAFSPYILWKNKQQWT